jgi:hypothetical protein
MQGTYLLCVIKILRWSALEASELQNVTQFIYYIKLSMHSYNNKMVIKISEFLQTLGESLDYNYYIKYLMAFIFNIIPE